MNCGKERGTSRPSISTTTSWGKLSGKFFSLISLEEIVNLMIKLLIMIAMVTMAMTPYPCCRDIALAARTATKELTCWPPPPICLCLAEPGGRGGLCGATSSRDAGRPAHHCIRSSSRSSGLATPDVLKLLAGVLDAPGALEDDRCDQQVCYS